MERNNRKSSKERRKRRRIKIFIFEIVFLLLLIGVLFVYAKLNGALGRISGSELDLSKVEINEGVEDKALHGYTTIALAGLDTRLDSKEQTKNSDAMIIVSINHDAKKVKLVSVYRDTYLNIGNDTYTKSNAAYQRGGPEQFLTMLNKNLDLSITDYAAVNFNSMAEAIDVLGGLDIELTENETVHINNYSIETSRVTGKSYEPLPKEAGVYRLNGVQCVSYARNRADEGLDFRRTARQRLIIYKMVEKAKASNPVVWSELLDKVCQPEMFASSLTKAEILKMGMAMITYDIEDQAGFPFHHLIGEYVKKATGEDCVLPVTLEVNVKKLHEFLYPEADYTPSATVREYSDHIIEESGYGEESIPAESEDGALPPEVYS